MLTTHQESYHEVGHFLVGYRGAILVPGIHQRPEHVVTVGLVASRTSPLDNVRV